MKKYLLAATALTLLASAAYAASYTTSNYSEDGTQTIGGTLSVVSGGTLSAASGSTVTLAGTDTLSGTTTISGATTITGAQSRTLAPSADSATTNKGYAVAVTAPVDTTGTQTHTAFDASFTIGNATGGTNTAIGYNFANVTGDAQVNVRGMKIGTGTLLGTSYGIEVGSGWDYGFVTASPISNTWAPSADAASTDAANLIAMTAPVDTTGTNVHNGIQITPTVSNATGGTNSFNLVKLDNVTGDAQVDVTGLNIGTGTTLGTSNAIKIGSGWDAGIVTDSGVQINSTNGTAVTALRFAFDAVANGQTSKTTTLTGATSSSRCVASAAETASNTVYVRSVVPGTDQVVITTSGDPGASNLDYTVICLN